jgi:hypothetical protein
MISIRNVTLCELSSIKDLILFCFSNETQDALKTDTVHVFKQFSRYEYFSSES